MSREEYWKNRYASYSRGDSISVATGRSETYDFADFLRYIRWLFHQLRLNENVIRNLTVKVKEISKEPSLLVPTKEYDDSKEERGKK